MNPNQSAESPETLRKLLKGWRVEAGVPPRFEELVWQRIAEAERSPRRGVWMAVRLWVETALSRPAVAVSCAALLLCAGLAAGYWHAQEKSAQTERELRAAYVQAVDPFKAMP